VLSVRQGILRSRRVLAPALTVIMS
jgi:hypothetical protein